MHRKESQMFLFTRWVNKREIFWPFFGNAFRTLFVSHGASSEIFEDFNYLHCAFKGKSEFIALRDCFLFSG